MVWNKTYTNVLFSVFIKDMGWYLGAIGKLHNAENVIYIFKGEVTDRTPYI